jgi:hypothetical protein
MSFPDWVEAQKKQGYEIKKIGNRYYMYERKSRWDKVRKKSVKVTGEYIGVVTPEGIIPRKERYDVTEPILSKEYGATAFVNYIAGDILESLSKHFDNKTAKMIWVVSVLRLIAPIPFQLIEEYYQASWMSKILPDLPLSKPSITDLMERVGKNRESCAAFMRHTLQPAPYIIIDRSRVTSKSKAVYLPLPHHNKNKQILSQIIQKYMVTVSELGVCMPGFYLNVAGNMPDISAYEFILEDAGVNDGIVLADDCFAPGWNSERLEVPNHYLKYIVPLKHNTQEVNLVTIEFEEHFFYHGSEISAHTEDKNGYRICVFRDVFVYAKEFNDRILRIKKINAADKTERNFHTNEDLHDISVEPKEHEDNFGIIIRTNIMHTPASYIYQIYNTYREIEFMFNTLRNTCEQDACYMQSDAGFEAWTFFNHVTMMCASRIIALLRENNLLKDWSQEGLLDHLSSIHKVLIADEWRITETTKKVQELILSLGFNLN